MFVPASITALLFVICIIPKHLWGVSYIVPLLPLLPVFYWGRLQTAEMPYWFVGLVGLLTDVVSSTPLGLTSLLYLLFLALLHIQSKYIHKEGFAIIWSYFTMLLALISALQWIVMSLLAGQLYAFVPALVQLFLTASIYPLFHKIFDAVAEHIKQRRWVIMHG